MDTGCGDAYGGSREDRWRQGGAMPYASPAERIGTMTRRTFITAIGVLPVSLVVDKILRRKRKKREKVKKPVGLPTDFDVLVQNKDMCEICRKEARLYFNRSDAFKYVVRYSELNHD